MFLFNTVTSSDEKKPSIIFIYLCDLIMNSKDVPKSNKKQKNSVTFL